MRCNPCPERTDTTVENTTQILDFAALFTDGRRMLRRELALTGMHAIERSNGAAAVATAWCHDRGHAAAAALVEPDKAWQGTSYPFLILV